MFNGEVERARMVQTSSRLYLPVSPNAHHEQVIPDVGRDDIFSTTTTTPKDLQRSVVVIAFGILQLAGSNLLIVPLLP
jgi:hypothetical protein